MEEKEGISIKEEKILQNISKVYQKLKKKSLITENSEVQRFLDYNLLMENEKVERLRNLIESYNLTKDFEKLTKIKELREEVQAGFGEIFDQLRKAALENKKLQKIIQELEIESKKTGRISEKLMPIEKDSLRRIKKRKILGIIRRKKKASRYTALSSKVFFELSDSLIKRGKFSSMVYDLKKTNMNFLPETYLSVVFFTTLLSFMISGIIYIFLLFFDLSATIPFIKFATESFGVRAVKMFWVIIVFPLIVGSFTYYYPSLEKKSIETKIDNELPFATINMAAISGSMINPSKIFEIIINTKEYEETEKQFLKLINLVKVYGYDFVSALKTISQKSPSMKLSELLNGLAVTINSGGDLPQFFKERAKTFLFEYKLEREKYTKFTETFMDIYISIVIAAPMILMLLLMIMKISGLGVSLSASMMSLIVVLGITGINIVFLTFLNLKQPGK